MDEKENINNYPIPANYTDSGKILGGMLSVRNAVEALILVLAVGYCEYSLLPISGTIRVIVMAVTLIPLLVFSLIGVNGDSLFTYIGHALKFLFTRRKIYLRREEDEEEESQKNAPRETGSQ